MDRKTIGRYEILDELGRGAMGSVLRARDPAMGRMVAIKSIHAASLAGDQAKEFRERFYREARAAGALAHPGIVPVFDVGEDDGVPYLVMELVQGRTLADAIKVGERYTLDQACEIAQQLAEAMGYAHRNGVIHRDIKPANILMTSRDIYGAERPRITDFGVAKLAGGEITSTGQLLGTPAFMSPEQFTGAPVDARSDLFSLGVILYRLATGEQPFPGETITAVSYKVVHTEPIPPSKLNPAVAPQLETVILKCLAKSPDQRYQAGEELASDLAAFRPSPHATGVFASTLRPAPYTTGSSAETIVEVSGSKPKPAPAPVPPMPAQTWVPATASFPPAQTAPPEPPPPAVQTAPPEPVRTFVPPTAPAPPMQTAPVVPPVPAAASATVNRVAQEARQEEPVPAAPAAETPTPAPRTIFSTMPPEKDRSARRKKKSKRPILAWLILLVLAIVGSWYFLHMKVQSPQQELLDAAKAPPPTPESQRGNAQPHPHDFGEPVGFNPRTLDPQKSTRLSLDLDEVPSTLIVTLQMDGKLYWSGTPGNESSYDGLLAPPGKHLFRVTISGGGEPEKTSNDVSAEFVARKRMTLMVEVQPQPNVNATTLDPSARVIAILKSSAPPM